MSFLKKYWYLLLVALITAGLGLATYLTSLKLKETKPVAPSVPQETPQAVAPACRLSFSITVPTPTPTGQATPTPTSTVAPTPTNTPAPTATPTPTQPPGPTAVPTPTETPIPTATPTQQLIYGPTPTPTPIPTPRVPVAGIGPSVLGAAAIAGGFLLLLLGLVL